MVERMNNAFEDGAHGIGRGNYEVPETDFYSPEIIEEGRQSFNALLDLSDAEQGS